MHMTKEKQNTKPADQPEKRFRHGNCTASVFANKVMKDGIEITARNVVLQKSYTDKSGAWQTTNSFGKNDLPKIIRAAEKAFDYLTTEA